MAQLHLVDWLIFAGYLGIVFAVGLWFSGEQQSNEDYFLGGRRMHWLPVGLSLFATSFSSLSFIGLPREAAFEDYHLLLAIFFIPLIVTPIVCIFFIPMYFALRVTSAYAYLQVRFNRSVRLLASLVYSMFVLGWMGSLLFAVSIVLQAVLGLSDNQTNWTLIGVGLFATLYTVLGGVKAVIWTDVLQAVVLGGGMVIVLVLAVAMIDGGWTSVWEQGVAEGKFNMFNMRIDVTERANFFSACAYGFFVYLASHATSAGIVQRYMSMPSIRAACISNFAAAFVSTAVCTLFFVVGTAIYCFYHQTGAGGFPALTRQDQLLPHFVLTELQVLGLTGLLVAGLFAAAMSSVDSGINTLTMTMTCDWLDGRKLSVTASRVLCTVFGLVTIGVAFFVPLLGKHVFDIIIRIGGTFFGLLLGVFALGLFVRRSRTVDAYVGMLTGATSLSVVWIATDVSTWWYGAITSVPTMAAGWASSYIGPRRVENESSQIQLS